MKAGSDQGLSWLTQISVKKTENIHFKHEDVAMKDLKERVREVGVAEKGVGRAAMSQRDFYLCAPSVSAVGERGQCAGI